MELIKPGTLLLNHHDIQFPEIPRQPPWDHRHLLGRRSDFWRRVAKVLWLISSGFSLTKEIRELIAMDESTNSRSGALLRLQPRLVDAGILRSELVTRSRDYALRLVALGPESERLIKRLKWQPVESEWDRMLRLHEKGKEGEEKHTLSVIAFAYHARLRGYPAGVMPAVEGDTHFAPDAIVIQDGKPVMAEIERSYKRNTDKWEQMVDYQGFVAFCGRTEKHRNRLIRETDWNLDIPGQATDLKTLFNESWEKPYGPLWAESW